MNFQSVPAQNKGIISLFHIKEEKLLTGAEDFGSAGEENHPSKMP